MEEEKGGACSTHGMADYGKQHFSRKIRIEEINGET
jgi:hypothetical protein